jgi:hypothetical protein
VKPSRAQIHTRVYRLPEIRFEDQRLTSFSGLIILQALFRKLKLRDRLGSCFGHLAKGTVVGLPTIALLLIVHLMLGYRRLRDVDRYRGDPLVARTLGLRRLPHVSTVSRCLARTDQEAVGRVTELNRGLVLDRLERAALPRVTLDFDGSVISSGRFAEGLAVGYNVKRKGRRSYYPLLCTVAQSAQVLNAMHRPGNVHDSNGAIGFMQECFAAVRQRLPHTILESRTDCAFFSDETATFLHAQGVQFTISVPFECFPGLKDMIEARRRWRRLDREWDYFETYWSPRRWPFRYRVLLLRHRVHALRKEPLQLELFAPCKPGYEFKAVMTNKSGSAKAILLFHNGRSAQENQFSELKSQCQMDYVPTRRLAGNQLYFLSAILAHNLYRELQMSVYDASRATTRKRATLWIFQEAATMRHRLIQLAGRLTRPQGRLRLTLSGNELTRSEYTGLLRGLKSAA